MQWYLLPVEFLFSDLVLSWQSVYYHYRKWCKAGVWSQSWIQIPHKYRYLLDLSSSDLDGSHTGAIKGGEQAGYQKRKKRKTTNSLYLTDRQGLPLSMSEPVSGNHRKAPVKYMFFIDLLFFSFVNNKKIGEMESISYTPGKALNETEGLSLIASYLRSGLSSAAFYKQIGMSEKTFYKWRKYYMQHQSSEVHEAEANVASCRFFPIEVLPEESSRDRESGSGRATDYLYEVEFSNGIRVRMQDSSGAGHLLSICNGLK